MSRIEFAPEVADDIDRIVDHLRQYDASDAPDRIRTIIRAIDALEHSPLIGRPVHGEKRELVIGRRSHGYVALYVYIAEIDTVFILALRSQAEAGYSR
jgi:plasmid stabilization system protein ParE